MNIDSVQINNFRSKMVSSTSMIDNANKPEVASFEQTLLKAFDDMNSKQLKTDELTKQMIIDPESVDVHDVTIAMAEANLSLKMAQTIVDRVVKGWNDISTSR